MGRAQAIVVIIASAFMTLVLVTFFARRSEGDALKAAPSIELQQADGSSFSLAGQKGKVVLVNFWATWCPPCVDEVPSLEAMHRKLAPRGLEVVAVSVDGDWQTVSEFVTRHGITYRVVLDPREANAHRYGTFKYPETFLVDTAGKIVRKWVGPVDWTRPEVMAEVEHALSGR